MTNILAPRNPGYRPVIPIYNYGPTDRVTFDDRNHTTCVETTKDGSVFVDANGLRHPYSHEQLYLMRAQDRIRVYRDYHATGRSVVTLRSIKLTDFGEDRVAKALFLKDLIDEFIRFEAIGKKHPVLVAEGFKQRKVTPGVKCVTFLLPILKGIIDARWAGRNGSAQVTFKLPKPRHFRRLYNLYVDALFDPLALVSLKTGPKTRNIAHRDDLELWLEYANQYADRKRPSMRNCLVRLKAEVLRRNKEREGTDQRVYKLPSRRCFENLIKRMGIYYLTAKRHGEEYALKRFAITHGGLFVERPGERVEIDEWLVDLSILFTELRIWERLTDEEKAAVKGVRVWLTAAIDCATKCVLAMHFSHRAPSYRSSMAALEMIVTDKSELSAVVGAGLPWIYSLVPEAIYSDAGPAFRHHRFRAAVAALRCEHVIPPSGQPAARGTVESFFHTCGLRFLDYFEGRTFSNVIERGKSEKRGRAVLNLDEVNRVLVRAIVDIYHTTPHSGLGFETPADAWERLAAMCAINQPLTTKERRDLFGTELERTISDKGVRVMGIHYNSTELQRHRFEYPAVPGSPAPKVKIRFGRMDISSVSFVSDNGITEAKSSIGIPAGTTVFEWVAARAVRLADVNAKANNRLSVQFAAVDDLLKSGVAAAARAGLGTDVITAEQYDDLEDRYFKDMSFEDDIGEMAAKLAILQLPRDPLEVGIEAFEGLYLAEPVEAPTEVAPAQAAVVERAVTSTLASSDDDISFE